MFTVGGLESLRSQSVHRPACCAQGLLLPALGLTRVRSHLDEGGAALALPSAASFLYAGRAGSSLLCGLLSSCGARAPHCGGFSRGARALGTWLGLQVVEHGLSCSSACGIFEDQGSNPRLLHWQADSSPLSHQGSIYF